MQNRAIFKREKTIDSESVGRKITIDRDSVCMGDDCVSHDEEITVDENMKLADLLYYLACYVPAMKDVVWAVCSDRGLCGYIITDGEANASIEVYGENITYSTKLKNVKCRYYHQNSFSWTDGKTGERVNKYTECSSLLEKEKKVMS